MLSLNNSTHFITLILLGIHVQNILKSIKTEEYSLCRIANFILYCFADYINVCLLLIITDSTVRHPQ